MLGFRAWTVKIPTTSRRVTRVYTTGKNLTNAPEEVSYQEFRNVDKITLGAIAHNKTWPENFMQATCMSPSKRHSHIYDKATETFETTPAAHCSCGIYAFYDYDFAMKELANHEIIGVVQGWGKIQIHETGFRAEFMRILGFIDEGFQWQGKADPDYLEKLLALSKKYVVPIMGKREAKSLQIEFSSEWKSRIFAVDVEDIEGVE